MTTSFSAFSFSPAFVDPPLSLPCPLPGPSRSPEPPSPRAPFSFSGPGPCLHVRNPHLPSSCCSHNTSVALPCSYSCSHGCHGPGTCAGGTTPAVRRFSSRVWEKVFLCTAPLMLTHAQHQGGRAGTHKQAGLAQPWCLPFATPVLGAALPNPFFPGLLPFIASHACTPCALNAGSA